MLGAECSPLCLVWGGSFAHALCLPLQVGNGRPTNGKSQGQVAGQGPRLCASRTGGGGRATAGRRGPRAIPAGPIPAVPTTLVPAAPTFVPAATGIPAAATRIPAAATGVPAAAGVPTASRPSHWACWPPSVGPGWSSSIGTGRPPAHGCHGPAWRASSAAAAHSGDGGHEPGWWRRGRPGCPQGSA